MDVEAQIIGLELLRNEQFVEIKICVRHRGMSGTYQIPEDTTNLRLRYRITDLSRELTRSTLQKMQSDAPSAGTGVN